MADADMEGASAGGGVEVLVRAKGGTLRVNHWALGGRRKAGDRRGEAAVLQNGPPSPPPPPHLLPPPPPPPKL